MPKSAAPTPALKVPLTRARIHWHYRQGLGTPLDLEIPELLAETGWARTLGGVDVYFALRARRPGMKSAELHKLVETREVMVMPAVRGCIYLVPRQHAALATAFAEEQARKGMERDMERAEIPQKEIDALGKAITSALKSGVALTTDKLRKALPEGSIRTLGEKGKKVGVSSPLPIALRDLEFQGKIERTLAGGRLDSQDYHWRASKPVAAAKVPKDAVSRHAELMRIFFHYAGPATLKDFTGWSLMSQKEALEALPKAGLAPVAVDGYSDACWVIESDVAMLKNRAGQSQAISFLAFEDNYLVSHGGVAMVVDPRFHSKKVEVWGSTKGSTLGDAGHITARTVVEGGMITGLWEYDPAKGEVVTAMFEKSKRQKDVDAAADDVAAFIRDDLQNSKNSSLDSLEQVAERAAALRKLG